MDRVLAALAEWQTGSGPFQLHPGDIGWYWRFGPEEVARDVRVWERHGAIAAVGLADGPTLWRLALSPDVASDTGFAERLCADIKESGRCAIEVPSGSAVRELLRAQGWSEGEPWMPLTLSLDAPVAVAQWPTEVTTAATVHDRVAVQRAAFTSSTFTAARWIAMAEGPAYARGRCIVMRDGAGAAVAATTVWTAGEGRPGLIEPLGVHRDHRGKGFGTAITLAAAAALRELGASQAIVCTPAANLAAVATYKAAGFVAGESLLDVQRS